MEMQTGPWPGTHRWFLGRGPVYSAAWRAGPASQSVHAAFARSV